MKNLISMLSLLLISSVIFAQEGVNTSTIIDKVANKSQELGWVDEQIKAIIPERKGISNSSIDIITEPFIFATVISTHSGSIKTVLRTLNKTWKPSLKVTLIINSKAFINGRWYGLNDRLYGYKITSIDNEKVSLVKNGKTKILSMKKGNKHIEINTK
ncbi:hypothetical protein KKA17_12150 [bacterium]|nr:hypothetical protein [bacterium]MBU1884475.1 hypothetical protein [bacterium]